MSRGPVSFVTASQRLELRRRFRYVSITAPIGMGNTGSITRLLKDWNEGEAGALDRLTRRVYRDLHVVARAYLGRARGGGTLQPTVLINELYIRLMHGCAQSTPWAGRSHFFGIAARLMRNIVVEYARAGRAAKRGGGARKIALADTAALAADSNIPDILDIDAALNRLALIDERKARVIELRYFSGLTRDEIASVAGLTVATVKRDLRLAEAWLRRDLAGSGGKPD